MATITGEMHCCGDCAMLIANNDTSSFDNYEPEVRASWDAGLERSKLYLPQGNPVINCPENCDGSDKQEFMCDYCSRNVYSHKFELAFLV